MNFYNWHKFGPSSLLQNRDIRHLGLRLMDASSKTANKELLDH